MSNSTDEPIVPDQVWTREEWLQQCPWTDMHRSPLRDFFKSETFVHTYSGGPDAFKRVWERYDGPTQGRFKMPRIDLRF